jgi:hypothetical protein
MDRPSLSSYQISDKVQFGGCFTKEQCVALGKKIMELYDGNKDGYLEGSELGFIISDAYRAMNRSFNPSQAVIASAQKIADRNDSPKFLAKKTGRVHTEDIQQLVYKYFHGEPPAEPVKKVP